MHLCMPLEKELCITFICWLIQMQLKNSFTSYRSAIFGRCSLLATNFYKNVVVIKKGKMALISKKWGYFHNQRVFCYKVLSIFIIHQELSCGGIAMKNEFIVFVYEIFTYKISVQGNKTSHNHKKSQCLSMVECRESSILVSVFLLWCMPRLHVAWGSSHSWDYFCI